MSGLLRELVDRGAHGLKQRTKAVLSVLAGHCARESSYAYPGVRRIAAMLNVGERQVREDLHDLEALGWIIVLAGTGRGPGNPSKYTIDFAAMREPSRVFNATNGRELIVAKPADVLRNKPAHVGRNWSDEKRRKFESKAPPGAGKAPHVPRENRHTGVNEPELNRIRTIEPLPVQHIEGNSTPAMSPPFKGDQRREINSTVGETGPAYRPKKWSQETNADYEARCRGLADVLRFGSRKATAGRA